MKKALVLALTVLMVLSLATAAFAVEVTYEGKVGVKFGGTSQGDTKTGPQFDKESLEATITVDFTKDYGNGVTAGVKTKVEAHSKIYEDEYEKNEDGTPKDENDGDYGIVNEDELKKEFVFDGAGWIQVEKDLFTVKAATKLNDQVGRDLKENTIPEVAGVSLKLNLIDGLTVNTVFNGGDKFNYVFKGEYADDLFTVGGGFQNDAENEKTAFGVYGTANLIDGLTLNAEYGNRKEGNKDAITAILASAAYEVGALNVKGTFLMQDAGFKNMNDDDADQDWRIIDAIRFTGGGVADNTAVAIDASYNLTDALKLEGYFDYLLSQKIGDQKVELKDNYAYKAGAVYTLDALTLSGWYKANGSQKSQFGGNATYKLVEGVETSFEVTSTTNELESKDAKLEYTAKVVATF